MFLQAFLDIVDAGRFKIVPPNGSDAVIDPTMLQPVEVNGLVLKKLTGRLKVRVLAVIGELIDPDPSDPLNRVVIDRGKAVWWSPVSIDADAAVDYDD